MSPHLNREVECSDWLDLIRAHLWTWGWQGWGGCGVSFLEALVICGEEEENGLKIWVLLGWATGCWVIVKTTFPLPRFKSMIWFSACKTSAQTCGLSTYRQVHAPWWWGSPWALVKDTVLRFLPWSFYSMGLGWSLRIFNPTYSPGDACETSSAHNQSQCLFFPLPKAREYIVSAKVFKVRETYSNHGCTMDFRRVFLNLVIVSTGQESMKIIDHPCWAWNLWRMLSASHKFSVSDASPL